MPWYKVEGNSGPGHQSRSEKYYWNDEELSDDEKKHLWEEFVEDMHNRGYGIHFGEEMCLRGITRLDDLPEKEKKQRIDSYIYQITNARKMLKILGATDVP